MYRSFDLEIPDLLNNQPPHTLEIIWTTILGAGFLDCHDSGMVRCLAGRGYFAQAVRIIFMNNLCDVITVIR